MKKYRRRDSGKRPKFPIPDLILRDAYLKIARKYKTYRENFVSRTELVEMVKVEIGPDYAHVRIDDIRERISTCCKSPGRHGGGWSATVNGHGPSRKHQSPQWYLDYLDNPHFIAVRDACLEDWGHACCLCKSSKHVEVHHNTYETLWRESLSDVVPLCSKCHKRHHLYMAGIPAVDPGGRRERRTDLF